MNVFSRGFRNAFRNGIRTFSIVIILGLSIGLALTMLVARQAVQSKIDTVKSTIGNTITISPAGQRGFEGGGNPLTSAEIAKVEKTAHVVSVTQMLNDRLTSENTNIVSAVDAGTLGQRFGGGGNPPVDAPSTGSGTPTTTRSFVVPVTLTGTNTITGLILNGGGKVSVTKGATIDPAKDANVALVSTTIAEKNNLAVGSTFTAYGATVAVVGIYDAGNAFANNSIVMPLATVQRLSSQPDTISSATVTVDSITNVSATATALQTALTSAVADVVSQQDSSASALAPLENIKNISLYSLIGAVVAGSIIILLTMLMIVRERRREIGVLKAIGSSNTKIITQFVTEAVTFTSIGALVGLAIGVLASSPVTKLLVTTSSNSAATTPVPGAGRGFGRILGQAGTSIRDVHAVVGWDILLWWLLAALIIAVIGSAIPAWMTARVRPADVMRAE